MNRMGELMGAPAKARHVRAMRDLLEDGKHQTVQHGQYSLYLLYEMEWLEAENPKKMEEFATKFKRVFKYIEDGLQMPAKLNMLKLFRGILSLQHPKINFYEQGMEPNELTKITEEQFMSQCMEMLQNFIDKGVNLNASIKSQVADWSMKLLFTQKGESQLIQQTESTSKLFQLIRDAEEE